MPAVPDEVITKCRSDQVTFKESSKVKKQEYGFLDEEYSEQN